MGLVLAWIGVGVFGLVDGHPITAVASLGLVVFNVQWIVRARARARRDRDGGDATELPAPSGVTPARPARRRERLPVAPGWRLLP